jgi:hypothetical protein
MHRDELLWINDFIVALVMKKFFGDVVPKCRILCCCELQELLRWAWERT